MQNLELHNELKQLSGYIYKNGKVKKPNGWYPYSESANPKTGFYAQTFIKDNTVAIVFKGTDTRKMRISIKDGKNDFQMFSNNEPEQLTDAQKYYEKVTKEFPNSKIILTGHSLGGSLAQILGAETGRETVTFGAYGTANLIDCHNMRLENITNYGNIADPVYRANYPNQIGKSYVIYNSDKIDIDMDKLDLQKHFIENWGDISKAFQIHNTHLPVPKNLKTIKKIFNIKLNYNDYNPYKVVFEEDIKKMPQDKFADQSDYIMHQMSKGLVMTKEQARQKYHNGELVWVNSYVRQDGTHVDGYYRTIPHNYS